MKNTIILCIAVLFSVSAFSYNSQKCRNFTRKMTGGGMMYNPSGILSSTTSFVTSTGDCAMIGGIEHKKKVFLVFNLENLKIDSAKGSGEYIHSYASLAGCNRKAQKMLPVLFQSNYMEIYGISEKEPKDVYESMEKVMKSDPIVSSGCYTQV